MPTADVPAADSAAPVTVPRPLKSIQLGGRPLPIIGTARMYVCGITPYDTTHLGHAATFVWADLAARILRHGGVHVEVCRNITDVDDDMLRQARAQGANWHALAARQTYRFEDDMRRLGVAPPTHEPLAHNYVDEVITLSAALLESGAAYQANGSVYFRGADVPARAGLSRDEALAALAEHGAERDEADRDDPLDVATWQPSAPGEPSWPSPWGPGRPGWHSECAAMAMAVLGTTVDLHGGGADLAFPHHAYEAAQAEAVSGVKPFARAWLRAGTVRIAGAKMAKSTGNLVFVHDLLQDWPASAVRLLILDRSWSDPWEYSRDGLEAAARRVDRLMVSAGRAHHDEAAEALALSVLRTDLNVPSALAIAEEAGGVALARIAHLLGLLERSENRY